MFSLLLVTAGYIGSKLFYHGSENIILLNTDRSFTSFADIIKRPEFKNKVIYVDIWGTSCAPCLEELEKYTPELTRRYSHKNDIAFLYLCLDRHPLPEYRWKNLINKFKPAGYHALVKGSSTEEIRLAKEIVGFAVNNEFFPYIPYYLIINKKGQMVGKQSADPNQGELSPDTRTKLYHKLDSLRNI